MPPAIPSSIKLEPPATGGVSGVVGVESIGGIIVDVDGEAGLEGDSIGGKGCWGGGSGAGGNGGGGGGGCKALIAVSSKALPLLTASAS